MAGLTTVNVHEAKTTLSELLRRVEAGEEIVIARGNTPVAVLTPYVRRDIARQRASAFGALEGTPPVPDSVFFGPMTDEEFIEMFGQEFFDLHADSVSAKDKA